MLLVDIFDQVFHLFFLFEALRFRMLFFILFWSLLGIPTATFGTETDIYCLKSIKASLRDPHGYLSSWDFSNNTEGFICGFSGVDCWHPDENRVVNLRLSDLGLKGKFPLGIENCSTLSGLDLSNNDLYGSIPSDISKKISFVISLDLSSNNFSGEIPLEIANCSYLNALKLDHNRLTGLIPQEIGRLTRIKIFTVSNNQLSGPVPYFMNASVSADSYANNAGLCGAPLDKCKEHHPMKFDYSFKSGFAIGYVVFAVSVVVVYASYCLPWVRTERGNELITVAAMVMLMIKKRKNKKAEVVDQVGNMTTMEFLLEKEVSTSENFVTRMSFKDLCEATENFGNHNIIGAGQIGTMHKATLLNGWSLAVKKVYNCQQSEEQFVTELKILGKLRHENLVPLLGFCKESKKRLLVYKYMSNGNLFDWLHSAEGKNKILEWPLRMKIAVGLAKALAWLHQGCDFHVAHLNINSKSVLLDENFEPKLSNFGMATLINPNEINSSRGFVMDIEFWEECFLKEDAFNFGIVLLELITGKMATSLNSSDGSLDKLVNDLSSSSSCLYDIVDKLLIGRGHDPEIIQCLTVACNCVQHLPEQRPTMLDVYKTICSIQANHHVDN